MRTQRISLGQYAQTLCDNSFLPQNDNSAQHRDMLRALSRAIQRELSPKQRQTVMLYYYDRLSIPKIAQLQGVNKSTVSRSLAAARGKLERTLRYGFFGGRE